MGNRATRQPGYVQKQCTFDDSVKFIARHVYNSSFCRKTVHNECQAFRGVLGDWYNTSSRYKPVIPGTSFSDVVKINLVKKGYRQAGPLVGTQLVSKSGEPLELVKQATMLSYDSSHANQRKPSLSRTLK